MKVATKTNSAEKMVKEALEKAKCCKNYNIFVSLLENEAIEKAKEIDARLKRGEKVGRLAGVPYALKDNYLTLSYIMFLLNQPNRNNKIPKYKERNKKLLSSIPPENTMEGKISQNDKTL